MEAIAKAIRARREVLRITQAQLSEIAGVGLRNLKVLESGKGNPKFNTMMKVANALGLTLELVVISSKVNHEKGAGVSE